MNINVIDFFIFFITLVILFSYVYKYYSEVTYVKSKVDNKSYLVRQLNDKEKAVDLLAEISKDLQIIVNHLVAKYPQNDDVKRLFKNFNPENISEGDPSSGYTSYSVNKGESIILCIRQDDKDKSFVEKNTILYVAIHELGHLMSKTIGHNKEFWDNFKFILNEAVNIGIYKKVDYKNNPSPYCGIKLTNSIIV